MASLLTPLSSVQVAGRAIAPRHTFALFLAVTFTLTLTVFVTSCKSDSSGAGGAGSDSGDVSVDAYGKSDKEDDFKIVGGIALAVVAMPNSESNFAINSNLQPLRPLLQLNGSYSCTMTLQKVDRDVFTLVDVEANTSCALAPAPSSGLYFRMTQLESDTLYIATVRAVDPVTNTDKIFKITMPPMSDACRAGEIQFTMIADTLTTRVANIVLELVTQADVVSAPPIGGDANAQKTLRNLMLPDLGHFAAASRQKFSDAARTYSETFSRIYDAHYAKQGDRYETAVCQALLGTLIKTGSITDNTNVSSQSSAVQSWLAISKLADTFNEEVKTVYTVTNVTASFDGFFSYLAAVIKAADAGNQVSAVVEIAPANQNATIATISESIGDTDSPAGDGTTSGGGTASGGNTNLTLSAAFSANCARCHGATGAGGSGINLRGYPRAKASFESKVRSGAGSMPVFATTNYSDVDLTADYTYLISR